MRYFMTFSYDGSDFNGYQKQPKGRTIQGEIESVLKKINGENNVSVVASGRTDAGVHAISQKAHFDMNDNISIDKLVHSLNSMLPDDIYVKDLDSSITGMIMRMVLVFTPYRNNFNYTAEVYSQYEKAYVKWQRAYKQGLYELQLKNINSNDVCEADINQFVEYMNQDLNVQNVMMLIEQIVKELNMAIRNKDIDTVSIKFNTLDKILNVLGINMFVKKMNDEQIEVYQKWNEARALKDFEKADIYRNMLVNWEII